MKIEEATVWAVMTNTDLTEGRGREYVKEYCETKATALRRGKRGYVQGTDCPVGTTTVFKINNTYYAPMDITPSTAEDRKLEDEMYKKLEVLEKAKTLGLTEQELKTLGVSV